MAIRAMFSDVEYSPTDVGVSLAALVMIVNGSPMLGMQCEMRLWETEGRNDLLVKNKV